MRLPARGRPGTGQNPHPHHRGAGLLRTGHLQFLLLGHCARNGVAVSWLTENGRFMASMHGPTTGNVLLRREQYRKTDSTEGAVPLARAFITGKIVNCRTVLRRAAREHPENHADGGLARVCESLTSCLQRLPQARSLEEIRGLEGEAAGMYFSVFDRLVSVKAKGIHFAGRSRRPPLDEINCLLSFLYTLLAADLRGAIESVGLDPAVGFLHRDRPGRPSLALDMMEEFRPVLADRLALTLVNRGQIRAKDFEQTASGAVLLKEKPARKCWWPTRSANAKRCCILSERTHDRRPALAYAGAPVGPVYPGRDGRLSTLCHQVTHACSGELRRQYGRCGGTAAVTAHRPALRKLGTARAVLCL